jgi:tRNA (mo5U34)-methyltransferase
MERDDAGAFTPEEIRRRVDAIHWYQSIDLGHGIRTPGVDDTAKRLEKYRIPKDLHGKSVLDIGAWDGFFSFECERRGARRVVALDSFSWTGEGWGSKEGFELARAVRGSRVEDVTLDVMDLSPERVGGRFDITLFLGVLYHLRHPLLGLERVASVTDDLLIIDTQLDLLSIRRPAVAFYPGATLNSDASNWWAPNPAALFGMLRETGFARFAIATPPYGLVGRAARSAKWALRRQNPFLRGLDQSRIVVHARRR